MIKTIKRKLSKKEKEEILKDWFIRDGKTFVSATQLNRMDWEATIGKGMAYSEYILKSPTDKELFKKGYTLAKNLLSAMILPVKTSLSIGGQQSKTDGKHVIIATECFDDKVLTPGEKLDVFLGDVVHEGAHIKYTDFSHAQNETNKILFDLCNITEDERIEINVGQDLPGFSRYLEKMKYYFFNKKFLEYKIDWDKITPIEKILWIFMRLIRYPTFLRDEDIDFLGDYLIRIKKVLVPYPNNTLEAYEAAKKIYEIIKELIAENKKTGGQQLDEKGKPKKGQPKEVELTDKDLQDVENELNKPDKELEKFIEFITAVAKQVKKIPGKAETASFIKSDQYVIPELEGIIERPIGRNVWIEKMTDNKGMYQIAYNDILPYIPAVRRHLIGHSKEYKYIHKSMRNGKLDTGKLVEAKMGIPSVYLTEGLVKTDKMNLVLLGDESGSMRGNKIIQARKSMILLKEAATGIPNINLFMYGHTAEIHGRIVTDLFVYYEPGYMPKYALGKMQARNSNRDGDAMLHAFERVRKFSLEPTLMIVMSDGEPTYDELSSNGSVNATREAVQKIQKSGWRIVQIAIDHSYEPGKMFDHFLILDDLSHLAQNLGKVVKKAVEKFSTIRVS